MNISLELSKGQLSKLRNGHGIRITPSMFGSGVGMIIDPMTYHNLSKKKDKGKGAVISMSGAEIEQNKIEGTGLFAGSGNKSGKISRFKKADKWKGFAKDLVNDGMDLGERGLEIFNKQKERQSPMGQFKRAFGGEMEGGKISFKGIKKAYNKNIKNTELGKALRGSASNLISDGYDRGMEKIGKTKNFKPIAEYMGNNRDRDVNKLTQMTGLGLRVSQGKGLKLSQGNGLRMSGGGHCSGCGMYNDKFSFSGVGL